MFGSSHSVKFLVLARILAPEDFGILAIAAVAVDLLFLVTDLGMVAAPSSCWSSIGG